MDILGQQKLIDEIENGDEKDILFIFNKNSGAFVATTVSWDTDDLDNDKFIYKKRRGVPSQVTWEGDVYSGRMVSLKDKKKVINEYDINQHTKQLILSKVSMEEQANINSSAINLIFETLTELMEVPTFKNDKRYKKFAEMKLTIHRILEVSKQVKQSMSEGDEVEFLSKEDVHTLNQQKTEGFDTIKPKT